MIFYSFLSDNPIARREVRAFIRRAYIWIPALLVVWIPMTWVTRILVQDLVGGNVSILAAEIFHALAMAFRPDVLIALLLVHKSASREGWHLSREELAVAFLSPAYVIVGKAIVPITILTIFHALGIGYYYSELLYDPSYVVSLTTGGQAYPIGIPIMLLAFMEDVFFATVVTLIAVRAYLTAPDPLRATLHAIGWLLLFGIAVCLCSWTWPVLFNFLPSNWIMWMLIDFGRFMLIGNIVWFSLILPLEAVIIYLLWRSLRKRVATWLQVDIYG